MFRKSELSSQLLDIFDERERYREMAITGDRIVPLRKRPESIAGKWLVEEQCLKLYETLDTYADYVNMLLEETPFRIQESEHADLTLTDLGSPNYGSSYEVFFCEQRVGKIEVYTLEGLEDFKAYVDVLVSRATFFPLDDLKSLLRTLQLTLANSDSLESELAIDRALTACLWSQLGDLLVPEELRLSLEGSYQWFFNYAARRKA